ANPCRCARKTRGFIEAGYVDPAHLLFAGRRVAQVREAAPETAAVLSTLDARCGEIFRRHPFYEPPDLVPALRRVLADPESRRAPDVWGRRLLRLGGMAIGVVTSLLLPLAGRPASLLTIYAIAGLGVAAFTPSALSLAGDAAPRGRIAYAYGWYSTAHYGAIGIGPFVGGLVAEWGGDRLAFVAGVGGVAFDRAVGCGGAV